MAEDVLHRLPEAEVDPEGERSDELRQADLRTIWIAAHTATPRRRRRSLESPFEPEYRQGSAVGSCGASNS
jgi:hypothetical protein